MDNAIKVLSLVPYKFLPPDMGGQKGIAFFNRYLSKHLNLVCVTTRSNEGNTASYPIKNILSNSKFRYINPVYFFIIKHLIKSENITHLMLEHPYFGWLAILLRWVCGIKLIAHSHNIEGLRFKSMNRWWWGILWHYEKLVHRNADHSFFIQDDDRLYAIKYFKLDALKCSTITYGFEHPAPPLQEELTEARKTICSKFNIAETSKILLFNGTLGYKPNLDALKIILEKINPILLASGEFQYKIIVCGNKLPVELNGLADYESKNIIYAGFVEDINLYFKGADIFINPVIDGGGIKTKVVEALGYNLSVISTQSGAIGIPEDITAGKLKIITDNDWEAFASQVILLNTANTIPPAYFEHFYWDNIAIKAAEFLNR